MESAMSCSVACGVRFFKVRSVSAPANLTRRNPAAALWSTVAANGRLLWKLRFGSHFSARDDTMDESAASRPAESSYRIEEHQPGRRLVLVWQGQGPHLLVRWLALAAVAAVLAGAAWFAMSQVVPVVRKEAANLDGDAIVMAVLGGLISLGACMGALAIARGVGRLTTYTSQMTCDAHDGTFEAVQSGRMLFGRRRLRGPLSTVTALEMTVGAELPGERLPITVSCLVPGKEVEKIVLPLPIDHVETRIDALELFCDLARITERVRYMVSRNDARKLCVSLPERHQVGGQDPTDPWDDDEDELDDDFDEDELDADEEEDDEAEADGAAEDSQDALPRSLRGTQVFDVPPPGERVDVKGPVLVHKFEEPPEGSPPFDSDALATEDTESRLVDWDPPRLLHSWRKAVERSVVIVAAVVSAIAGAIVGAWPLNGLAESVSALPPSRWETGALGALLAAFVAGFLVWALNRPREVTIDVPAGTIACRQGEQVRTYRTDHVCEVTLIGEKENRSEAGKSSEITEHYRCRIELGVAQSDEWVFDSPWSPRRTQPYRQLHGMAIDLARMLNVPFRWQDYDQPTKPAWHRRLGWKERAVLAALALSVVGYLASQAIKRNIERDIADAMRVPGTEVSFMNGYSIQDHLVLADYWQVTIKPDQFDNEKLQVVTAQLQQLDRVGLVVEDTALGDAGMADIGKVKNLLLLDANSTNVTSDGMQALAELDELVYLGLANTIVGDSGLERLPPLASLKFLNLSTTNLTDRGVDELAKFPSLEHVMLYNLHISDAAVDRLKAARPNLEIAR